MFDRPSRPFASALTPANPRPADAIPSRSPAPTDEPSIVDFRLGGDGRCRRLTTTVSAHGVLSIGLLVMVAAGGCGPAAVLPAADKEVAVGDSPSPIEPCATQVWALVAGSRQASVNAGTRARNAVPVARDEPTSHDVTAWLGFDVAEIPDGAPLAGMSLVVYTSIAAGAPTLRVYSSAANDWNPETVNAEDLARTDLPISATLAPVVHEYTAFEIDVARQGLSADLADGWLTLGVDNTRPTHSFARLEGIGDAHPPMLAVGYCAPKVAAGNHSLIHIVEAEEDDRYAGVKIRSRAAPSL